MKFPFFKSKKPPKENTENDTKAKDALDAVENTMIDVDKRIEDILNSDSFKNLMKKKPKVK